MWLIEHADVEYTPKIRTEFDAYKTRRMAVFVPKRQNLSRAPLDARKDIRGRRIVTDRALETWMEKILND